MQKLLVIKDGRVIVQSAEKTYTDTVENFVTDGGSISTDFSEIDCCIDTCSCVIDGEPADIPAYAVNTIKRIDEFCDSYEARKAEREEAERIDRNEREERERQEAEQARWNALSDEEKQEELFLKYRQIATDYLNDTAKERLYDDIKSLKGFTTSTNEKWRAEAFAGIAFEDAVWSKCYEILNAVQAGEMEIPSEDEFIALLPNIDW